MRIRDRVVPPVVQRAALLLTGLRIGWRGRIPFMARFGIYAVVTGIFASVYSLTSGQAGGVHTTVAQLVWYSGLTEIVVIVAARTHAPIVASVRDGDFPVQFVHPLSPSARHFWLGFGESLSQACMMLALGVPWLWLISGGAFPLSAAAWLAVLPLGALALALRVRLGFCVGVIEIFGPYATPMAWFMGKFVFLFGGILLPLNFYPQALRRALVFTPFPSMLYAPASRALGGEAPDVWGVLAAQLFWLLVLLGAVQLLEHIAARRLQAQGG